MRGKRDGRPVELRVVDARTVVAAVLGGEHARLLDWVPVRRGPAEVGPFAQQVHDLRDALGVVEFIVEFRGDDVEVVATHLGDEKLLRYRVKLQPHRMPVSGREPRAVGLGLVEPVGVEAPETAVRFLEFRDFDGRLALRPFAAVAFAEDVVGRTDLHQQPTLVVEGEGLGVVVLFRGQILHDGFHRARRHEFARGVLVAVDRGAAGVIEPAVVKQDVRATVAGTELLDQVGATVAVGVTQRPDQPEFALGVDVTVGCDGQATQLLRRIADAFVDHEIVGIDQRPETRRQGNGAVVGVGGRQVRGGGRGAGGQGGEHREQDGKGGRAGHRGTGWWSRSTGQGAVWTCDRVLHVHGRLWLRDYRLGISPGIWDG